MGHINVERQTAPPSGDYRALIRALPAPLALLTLRWNEARVIDVTDAFAHAFAIPAESLSGRSLGAILPLGQALAVTAGLRRCLRSGSPEHIAGDATLMAGPAGQALRLDPVAPDPDGAERMAVLSFDAAPQGRRVTRKRAAMFEQLGPLGGGMFYVTDLRARRVSYVDPRLASMFGIAAEHGAPLADFVERIHPDDLHRLDRHFAEVEAAPDHHTSQTTLRMRHVAGKWIWICIRARPFSRNRDGSVRRIVGAAADVTRTEELSRGVADIYIALSTAQETERRRIGRELHDSTSQHLVAIDLSLRVLEARGLTPEQGDVLRDMRQAVGAAHREIRTLSYMLHPPRLAALGLPSTLSSFCEGFGKRTGLQIDLSIPGDIGRHSYAIELALFRCAQEGLMNAHRHSGARTVSVRLRLEADCIALHVEDDGVGLTSERLAEAVGAGGVGIEGMRARLAQLGGSLMLGGRGSGLHVTARAPLTLGHE